MALPIFDHMNALASSTDVTAAPSVAANVGHRQATAVAIHEAGQLLAAHPDNDGAYRDLEAYEAGVSKCTTQELRLAVELARGAQLADALIRAGYRFNSARQRQTNAAFLITRKPHVHAVLAGLRRSAVMRAEVSVAQVRAEQARIAFSNVNHYEIDHDGSVNLKPGAPLDAVQAVSSVEIDEVETQTERGTRIRRKKKLRLWDKSSALKALAADLGMASGGEPGRGDVNVHVAVVEVHGGDLGMHRTAPAEVGTVELGDGAHDSMAPVASSE